MTWSPDLIDELPHDPRRAAQELLRRLAFGEPWPVNITTEVAVAIQDLRREQQEDRARRHAEVERRNNERSAWEREQGRIRQERIEAEERRQSQTPSPTPVEEFSRE
jgi:hypothetical protein